MNEAVNDTATGTTLQPLKKSTWYPDIPDYITVAFETARDTCDDCILFYVSTLSRTIAQSPAVYLADIFSLVVVLRTTIRLPPCTVGLRTNPTLCMSS